MTAGKPGAGAWLIVEDEALVAMGLQDALTELGLSVAGPFARVHRALPAAEHGDLAGAILDVNVAGERIDPVAVVLKSRGIPFIFMTGYGAEGVSAAFREYPVLVKPVLSEHLREALRTMGALPPAR
ncbi:MAG: response regulator [Alphaproteobacteria bacterium]